MMRFLIVNKNVFYRDRKSADAWLQCIPQPKNFLNTIKLSRNRLPTFLIEMFTLTPVEQKEYDEAKTEEALAEIIVRDCKTKGATLILKAKEDDKNLEDIKIIN